MADKSKLQLERESWIRIKDDPRKEWVILKIAERVFNNADYALRKRKNQTKISPTIAADFTEAFGVRETAIAHEAFTKIALDLRRLGARVFKQPSKVEVASMSFYVIKLHADLEGVDLKKIQAKFRKIRSELKKLAEKKRRSGKPIRYDFDR